MYVDPLTGTCLQDDNQQYFQPLPGFNQLTNRYSSAPLDYYNIPLEQWTPTSPPIDDHVPYNAQIDYCNLDTNSQDINFIPAFVDTPAPDSPPNSGGVFRFAPEDIERFHNQNSTYHENNHLLYDQSFLEDAPQNSYFYNAECINLSSPDEKPSFSEEESMTIPITKEEEMKCRWLDCHLTFNDRRALVGHIEKTHVKCGKAEEYSCLWLGCPRSKRPFNARYKLLIHMRVHSGDKPNKCSVSVFLIFINTINIVVSFAINYTY